MSEQAVNPVLKKQRLLCARFLLAMLFCAGAAAPTVSAVDYFTRPGGFIEGAAGLRPGDSMTKREYNLLEGRLQLRHTAYPDAPSILGSWNTVFFINADFIGDFYEEEPDALLRECYLNLSPASFVDVKVGRQILTWGTGDLVFIADLFPKDYVSFFIGRDDELLKVPSDALKVSFFSDLANLDFVIIPRFKSDTELNGDRLTFYNPLAFEREGEDASLHYHKPHDRINNTEMAFRLSRMMKSYEISLYAFRGYFKQAAGVKDFFRRDVYYPALSMFGASLRGPFIGGIGSCELGYYKSREDTRGDDPFIENSSLQYLAAYEREFKNDLIISWQYHIRQMLRYNEYKNNQPLRAVPLMDYDVHLKDHWYQLATMRVTKLMLQQNLELSLFAFYSPSDHDYHVRPRIAYKISDRWKVVCGYNLFGGRDDYTQFGQFKGDSSVYARLRYSF
jgi:hypothetical protein